MRNLRGVWGALLVSSLFLGCGEDSGSSGPDDPGSGAAGSSPSANCDGICFCSTGRAGQFDCATNTCQCAECPELTPPEPAPFEACGGDPTGFWRLRDYDPGAVQLSINTISGSVGMCSGLIPEPFRPTSLMLELKANGEASLHSDYDSYKFQVTTNCLASAGTRCSALRDYECEEQTCGVCECSVPAAKGTFEELTWSAKDGQLTLVSKSGRETMPFCVSEGTLSYRGKGLTNLAVLERVYRAGDPQACAERSPENCTASGQNRCTLGQCVGTGSCSEALNEATFAKFQDCQWDATSCHGSVEPRCTLTDFLEGTPGCTVSEKPPVCRGTPAICENQPRCEAKGCLFGAACLGGMQPCDYDDEGIEGCICDLSCTGTLNCATLKDPSSCKDAGDDRGAIDACYWSTTACVATPAPCEELTLDECEATLGCVLEPQ